MLRNTTILIVLRRISKPTCALPLPPCSQAKDVLRAPGGEDNFDDEPRAWLTGVFGVLYTCSKEKDNIGWLFAGFRLFMDWLQLFLLTMGPAYGWNINASNL